MSAICNVKIDLNKIDKSKIFEAKSGAKYYEFTVALNDKTSQYGENISVSESQTKEERDAKAPKTFIGGGKVLWVSNEGVTVAEKTQSQATNSQAPSNNKPDLPF
jgi:hypothetical protein